MRSSNRVAVLFLLCAIIPLAVIEATPFQGNNDDFTLFVQPFFRQYCVKCHGALNHEGGISLHDVGRDLSSSHDVESWESILAILKRGEMPPADELQPKEQEVRELLQWIESELQSVVDQEEQASLEPTTRRLTNTEYQNTLRDLLGFQFDVIDDLPADPAKPYEFNNTPDLMRIGPEQIDRYLEIARKAMASAIVDPGDPEVHKTRKSWPRHGLDRGLALDEIGVYGNRRHSVAQGMGLSSFPQVGAFRIRVKASAILPPGYDQVPLRLIMGNDIQVNSSTRQVREVGVVSLTNSPDHPEIYEFVGRIENFPPLPGRTVKGKQLPDQMTITPQNIWDDGSLNDRFSYGTLRNIDLPRVVIDWMEFESPVTDVWPPIHHRKILFDSPLRERDPEAYIREVLRRFLTKAFRRPARDEEVLLFAQIYDLVQPDFKTMEAALRETLSMVLISPQFLYHTESSQGMDPHHAMASRLSYFLWASMPDEELLDLAAEKKLDDPMVIEQQVLRLLADPRSGDFIKNFTQQWLSLQKMKTVPINRDLFPRFLYYVPAGERAGTEMPYLPTVRDYMMQETIEFVGEMIRRNASVMNVVDSDFAMLNQRLAAHYGVEGITGVQLRPVPIGPDHHLGGLLTQGAVLLGNGTGTAPHPIYRAVWLREAILGDDVPDPPAEVPALTDTAGESAEKALTIAELLARHRTQKSCNSCHFRLDPWGIPFEQYNAIGQFQAKVPSEGTRVSVFQKDRHTDWAGYQAYLSSLNTVEISAEAQLPNGLRVAGLQELKAYLMTERKDDIIQNVVRRLLSYSVGRKLTFRDRFAVQDLINASSTEEYGMRDIIVSICQSELFRGDARTKKD